MIKYFDGQITDILPRNLTQEPAAQAYSAAVREGTRLLYKYTQLCYVYCNIETAPEPIIDLLAKELRTQYYNDAMELEVKRGLVRNTLIWYMTSGTPAAVEELVAIVFGEGEVAEWFEYGGEPYWFKIKTNALMTEDMLSFFSDMIRRVKNTRSHIQAIEIHRTIEQTLYAGACADPHYRPAPIIDGYEVGRQIDQTIHAGATAFPEYRPAAIIDGYEEARTSGNVVHAGTAEASQTRQEAVREALSFEGEEIHTEPLKTGTAATGTTKPAAIIDGYKQEGETVEAIARSAGTAAGEGAAKPAAIIDGYKQEAEAVKESIFAGLALNSRYTKTIVREGGSDDATTI